VPRVTILRHSHNDRCCPPPFDLRAFARKKLTVDFDGGYLSSGAGLLLSREAQRQRGGCRLLVDRIVERRDQSRICHEVVEIVTARVMTIACGHEYAIDHDHLRHAPLLKMAFGRAPETGAPLATQSTISRFEYAPTKWEAVQLTPEGHVMIASGCLARAIPHGTCRSQLIRAAPDFLAPRCPPGRYRETLFLPTG
jgi:hypothetical protein